MSEDNRTWLTQEAFDRLSESLRAVVPLSARIARRMSLARQEGDLRENAGYHAAREEAALNETRIKVLEGMLENAEVGQASSDRHRH